MRCTTGYARITYSDAGVYFRIEAVSREKFHSMLDMFLDRFPVRVWNDHRRAWQLPHNYAGPLVKFAMDIFGKERVVVEQAYQMTLPL